jgi:hypothetical protein
MSLLSRNGLGNECSHLPDGPVPKLAKHLKLEWLIVSAIPNIDRLFIGHRPERIDTLRSVQVTTLPVFAEIDSVTHLRNDFIGKIIEMSKKRLDTAHMWYILQCLCLKKLFNIKLQQDT